MGTQLSRAYSSSETPTPCPSHQEGGPSNRPPTVAARMSRNTVVSRLQYGYHGHMKKASIAHLKNNLSRYLAYVQQGGRVIVYKRDEPVAEIVPVRRETLSQEAEEMRLQALERAGIVRRGTGRIPAELLEAPPGKESGVLEALLDERRSGR